ncbi:hypothetical protein N800_14000 [Lysobacter daejeonensis GH1-9]|uniref:Integral membrane protein n=1 Tax=Lysobacter daejeonensis GH1-9 TaxID=1385517 RepID=A0A0A0EY52_9GAMM|nr:hypothetical protein [Lysobacter daejeonensis]KGM55434.1 hypothetical protein N800_14000 [Lysobacter daejeonensis GH1-9]
MLLAPLIVVVGACARSDDAPARTAVSGFLLDPQLSEISGLATSRRHPGTLWLHDDGGNPARLFAVSTRGLRRATYRVEGVNKTDWEDIAAFRLDGRDYLLLADTGDNGGLRRTLQLHVIEEPGTLENGRLTPAWSIAFRWPDGARDCEAVAVDAKRGQILLVSKKRQPPELFALPLRPRDKGVQTARALGPLAGVPQPSADDLRQRPQRARYDAHVTAADVSPDGRTLAVMTYRYLLFYPTARGQGWGRAVARAPQTRILPWLPQAEAMGWALDGDSVYATGEFVPAPLYRVRY